MRLISDLLSWYTEYGRDLPWRKTTDPYAILVSECMLQQTQVPRVLPYYERWLIQFPDWHTLANASTQEVLHAWSGLGYNRRALALQTIAKAVIVRGHVPTNAQEWMTLKGIGPYTSAAVACFSQQEHVLPIDTNIRRVLGRVLLGVLFPQPSEDASITKKTSTWLKNPKFFHVPQALFDLATNICKKRPSCELCPLQTSCLASKAFLQGDVVFPKRTIAKHPESHHLEKPFPDRIYRGRIVKLLREKTFTRNTIGPRVDPDFDGIADQAWLSRMIDRLIRDGLVHEKKGRLWFGANGTPASRFSS